jgi:hypothetical protein
MQAKGSRTTVGVCGYAEAGRARLPPSRARGAPDIWGTCPKDGRCSFRGLSPGKAVASDHLRSSSYGASANLARSRHGGATADHLRSSSYGASANLARSRHSGATAERLPYLRRSQVQATAPNAR